MLTTRGFTLIESIVAIVLIALAMLTLTSFLYPQIERSATPHYQVRAVNLSESMLRQILARAFDHRSDFDGGMVRCGEPSIAANPCSATLGAESGETAPADFNDVDDYIGCYTGEFAESCPSGIPSYTLSTIVGQDVASQYRRFQVQVSVEYVSITQPNDMKRIQVDVSVGDYGDFTNVAFRGNY